MVLIQEKAFSIIPIDPSNEWRIDMKQNPEESEEDNLSNQEPSLAFRPPAPSAAPMSGARLRMPHRRTQD
ncbi:hypothetical protein [Delftia tsuruhatensis]|uniref:hypothetical protein n=1 Tax=Delftia tsuruhatensis TaxID=180282 RepID=UPI001F41DAC8|nr:hypothetical protein [Delftia tsuruhatensis]